MRQAKNLEEAKDCRLELVQNQLRLTIKDWIAIETRSLCLDSAPAKAIGSGVIAASSSISLFAVSGLAHRVVVNGQKKS